MALPAGTSTMAVSWNLVSDGKLTDAFLQQQHSFSAGLYQFRALNDQQKANPGNLGHLNQSLPSGMQSLAFQTHAEPAQGPSQIQGIQNTMTQKTQTVEQTKTNGDSNRNNFRAQALQVAVGSQDGNLNSQLTSTKNTMTQKNSLVVEAFDLDIDALLQKHLGSQTFASSAERVAKTKELKHNLSMQRVDAGVAACNPLLQVLETTYVGNLSKQTSAMTANDGTFDREKESAHQQRLSAQKMFDDYDQSQKALQKDITTKEAELDKAMAKRDDDKENAAKKLEEFLKAIGQYHESWRQALFKEGQLLKHKAQLATMESNKATMATVLNQVNAQDEAIAGKAVTYTSQAQSAHDQVVRDVTNHHKPSFLKEYEGVGLVKAILQESRRHNEQHKKAAEEFKAEAEALRDQEEDMTKQQLLASEIKQHEATITTHTQKLTEIAGYETRMEAILKDLDAAVRPNDAVKQECCKALQDAQASVSAYFVQYKEISSPLVPARTQERRAEAEVAEATAASSSTALVKQEAMQEEMKGCKDQMAMMMEMLQAMQYQNSQNELQRRMDQDRAAADAANIAELQRRLAAAEKERDAERANKENRGN